MKKILMGVALVLAVPMTACTTGQTSVESASIKAVVLADATFEAASRFGRAMVHMKALTLERYQELQRQAHDGLLVIRAGGSSLQFDAAVQGLYSTGEK